MSSNDLIAESMPVVNFSYEDVTGAYSSSPRGDGVPQVGTGVVRLREDELTQQLKLARAEGVREGEQKAAARFEEQLTKIRRDVTDSCQAFTREQQDYYNHVEVEVVHLALAIAAKILHREAQVDRLVLSGVIRASLQKLQAGSSVKLRVNPAEAKAWRDFITQEIEISHRPEVVEDNSLQAGACVIDTDLGSAELGIEAQLKEIETGLSDLLAHRPQIL